MNNFKRERKKTFFQREESANKFKRELVSLVFFSDCKISRPAVYRSAAVVLHIDCLYTVKKYFQRVEKDCLVNLVSEKLFHIFFLQFVVLHFAYSLLF